jgi:hypothetical protein
MAPVGRRLVNDTRLQFVLLYENKLFSVTSLVLFYLHVAVMSSSLIYVLHRPTDRQTNLDMDHTTEYIEQRSLHHFLSTSQVSAVA